MKRLDQLIIMSININNLTNGKAKKNSNNG